MLILFDSQAMLNGIFEGNGGKKAPGRSEQGANKSPTLLANGSRRSANLKSPGWGRVDGRGVSQSDTINRLTSSGAFAILRKLDSCQEGLRLDWTP